MTAKILCTTALNHAGNSSINISTTRSKPAPQLVVSRIVLGSRLTRQQVHLAADSRESGWPNNRLPCATEMACHATAQRVYASLSHFCWLTRVCRTSQGSSGPAWMDENLPLASTDDRRRLWSPASAYRCSNFFFMGPCAKLDITCSAQGGKSMLEKRLFRKYKTLEIAVLISISIDIQKDATFCLAQLVDPLLLLLLLGVLLSGGSEWSSVRVDCDASGCGASVASVGCMTASGSPPVMPCATAGVLIALA